MVFAIIVPSDLWLFDTAFANYQQRIKVEVVGTRNTGYRDGDYENKAGKILSATRVAPEFEQTALIKFDTLDDPISIQSKYILPIPPQHRDEEVLVLDGEHKGKVFIVREKPDRTAGVSSKQEPASIIEVSTDTLVALYPEE
jgi:transcription elongation factor SPT5